MIPDFQALMLPLLKFIADGRVYQYRDIVEHLAREFELTDEERRELLSSGVQPVFDNRVGWAKTYLKKAGLIDSPKRAAFIITEEGKRVLSQNPSRIDVKFLRNYPSFIAFQSATRTESDTEDKSLPANNSNDRTPEENLEIAYQSLRKALAEELLDKVINLSPAFFERLVVELLVRMGYGGSIQDAGKAIGKSSDEGIDGIIKEDKLGLDVIYIQAKKWKPDNVVGRPELQKFVGALAGQGAKKGIFITTSSFTKDAREYMPRNETKIVLIDGGQLAQLMIDYNLGCSTQKTYEIKRIDNDYFDED